MPICASRAVAREGAVDLRHPFVEPERQGGVVVAQDVVQVLVVDDRLFVRPRIAVDRHPVRLGLGDEVAAGVDRPAVVDAAVGLKASLLRKTKT